MTEFTEAQIFTLDALKSLKIARNLYQINTIGRRFNPDMAEALNTAYNHLFDELAKDIGAHLINKHKMLGNT